MHFLSLKVLDYFPFSLLFLLVYINRTKGFHWDISTYAYNILFIKLIPFFFFFPFPPYANLCLMSVL
jgi:hypothetical protein